MKKLQVCLLISMVILFFVYALLDIYAWPLSKTAENIMNSLFAVILLLIEPKNILDAIKGETTNETIVPVDKPADPPV